MGKQKDVRPRREYDYNDFEKYFSEPETTTQPQETTAPEYNVITDDGVSKNDIYDPKNPNQVNPNYQSPISRLKEQQPEGQVVNEKIILSDKRYTPVKGIDAFNQNVGMPEVQQNDFTSPEPGKLNQVFEQIAPETVKRERQRQDARNRLLQGVQQGSETVEPLTGQKLGDLKLKNAPMDGLRNAINSVANSGLKMIPGTIEALGLIADKVVQRGMTPQILPEDMVTPEKTVSGVTGDVGKTIRKGIDSFAPVDPNVKGFFSSTLPSAVGSGLGFMLGGYVGKVAKIPTAVNTLLLSTSQAAEEYNAALQQTGDYQKAYNTFIGNLPFAATEVLPFERLFSRLEKIGGKRGTQLLIEMLTQGTVEGSQEILQQFGANLNAKVIYDATRSLSEGTLEGGAAGFVTGMLMAGLGNVASRKLEEGNLSEQEIKDLAKAIEQVNLSKAKVEKTFKDFAIQESETQPTEGLTQEKTVTDLLPKQKQGTSVKHDNATQLEIMKKAGIPEEDMPNYALSSVADGKILRSYLNEVKAGDITVDEAAERVKRDYQKMKTGEKEAEFIEPTEEVSTSGQKEGRETLLEESGETKVSPEVNDFGKASDYRKGKISDAFNRFNEVWDNLQTQNEPDYKRVEELQKKRKELKGAGKDVKRKREAIDEQIVSVEKTLNERETNYVEKQEKFFADFTKMMSSDLKKLGVEIPADDEMLYEIAADYFEGRSIENIYDQDFEKIYQEDLQRIVEKNEQPDQFPRTEKKVEKQPYEMSIDEYKQKIREDGEKEFKENGIAKTFDDFNKEGTKEYRYPEKQYGNYFLSIDSSGDKIKGRSMAFTNPYLTITGKGLNLRIPLPNGLNKSVLNKIIKETHKNDIKNAISEGKIKSHPDYPELTAKGKSVEDKIQSGKNTGNLQDKLPENKNIVSKYSEDNPFAKDAIDAELRYNRLFQPTAHEKGMAESFPLGAGFGRGSMSKRSKALDASIKQAGQRIEIGNKLQAKIKRAEDFEKGLIDKNGNKIETEGEKTARENLPKVEQILFDKIQIGDQVGIAGSNNKITVTKKNAKSVLDQNGNKWTEKELSYSQEQIKQAIQELKPEKPVSTIDKLKQEAKQEVSLDNKLQEIKKEFNLSIEEVNNLKSDANRLIGMEKMKEQDFIDNVRKTLAEKEQKKDNNKTSALRMFGEGKKDTEVVTALGLKGKAGMDQVREWRKEFKQGEPDRIFEQAKKDFNKMLENSKPEDIAEVKEKGGAGLVAAKFALRYVKPPQKNQELYNKIYDIYFDYFKSEPKNQVKPIKPEPESKGKGEENWKSKSLNQQIQESGINDRIEQHPDFTTLKAAMDKMYKKATGKNFSEDHEPADYLMNHLPQFASTQSKIAKDLGLELRQGTYQGRQLVIPEPKTQKEIKEELKPVEKVQEKAKEIVNDVIEANVEILGQDEKTPNLKKQKQLLLDRLDKQIEIAKAKQKDKNYLKQKKEIDELASTIAKDQSFNKRHEVGIELKKLRSKIKGGTTTLRIPNDGDVTIPSFDYGYLVELRKKINSQYPTDASLKTQTSETSIKLPESSISVSPDKQFRGEGTVGDGYFQINGNVILKGEAPKTMQIDKEAPDHKKKLQDYMDKQTPDKELERVGYVVNDIDYDYSAATKNKIPHKNAAGLFKLPNDTYLQVRQEIINLVDKYYPDAKFFSRVGMTNEPNTSGIVVMDKGKKVGMMMPFSFSENIANASKDIVLKDYPDASYLLGTEQPTEPVKPEQTVEKAESDLEKSKKQLLDDLKTITKKEIIGTEKVNDYVHSKYKEFLETGDYPYHNAVVDFIKKDLPGELSIDETDRLKSWVYNSSQKNSADEKKAYIQEMKNKGYDVLTREKAVELAKQEGKQFEIIVEGVGMLGNKVKKDAQKYNIKIDKDGIPFIHTNRQTKSGFYVPHFTDEKQMFVKAEQPSSENLPEVEQKSTLEEKSKPEELLSAKAEEQITSPEFKNWFGDWENEPQYSSKVVDDTGKPLVVYSGHSNTPLYENFDPKKATAGGFYTSEDPQVASNYSIGKFGAREGFENGSQYRIKGKNGKYNKKLWQIELTPEQKAKLDQIAEQKNEYGEYDYKINEMMRWAKESKDYEPLARRILARGKYDLQSIHDFNEWMGYNIAYPKQPTEKSEPLFERQVKNDTEEIMDALGLEWQAYDWNQPGVFPVYLNIRKPLDADKPFPQDLMQALKEKAKYERERNVDQIGWTTWTKDYPLKEWIRDIEEGSEGWTTQVPKKALPILKQFGYDGIKERGNKGLAGVLPREQRQINWIAFEPTQIKSAIANKGQFDPDNKDMLLSAGLDRPIKSDDFIFNTLQDFHADATVMERTDLDYSPDRRIIAATRQEWIDKYNYDPVINKFRIVKQGEEGYDPKQVKFRGTAYGGTIQPTAWRRGKIAIYGRTDMATILEEVVHIGQAEVKRRYPELAGAIEQFENSARKQAKARGIDIPLGQELFAKSFVAQTGYKTPENTVVIPQLIYDEFAKFLNESKSGEPAFDKYLKPQKLNQPASKAPKSTPEKNFTFEGGKLEVLSAQHEPFAPAFFSKMEKVLNQKLPNTFSSKQAMDIVRSGEIKEAEVKWSGIEDWLLQNANKKLTKEDLNNFLKMNELQVKEVNKYEDALHSVIMMTSDELAEMRKLIQAEGNFGFEYPDQVTRVIKEEGNNFFNIYEVQSPRLRELIQKEIKETTKLESEKPKFLRKDLVLPGGLNYREILFTLPSPVSEGIAYDKIKFDNRTGEYYAVDRNGEEILRDEYHERLIQRLNNKNFDKGFKSSHWDEPNVFAHTRVDDRVVNGKKILHIEEVQSDWALAGRKQGFKSNLTETEQKRLDELVKYSLDPTRHFDVSESNEMYQLQNKSVGVPDMPFKTNWHEYTLKNLLRKAAEEGYDGISWTTGEQQAERYDLSKQVDKIEVSKLSFDKGGDRRYVKIYPTGQSYNSFNVDKNGIITKHAQWQGKKLDEVVGKELAEKIMDVETKKNFEGLDLKVGGQWATNLYDKVIPNFLNKYGKKWNAKVGEARIPTGETELGGVYVEEIKPDQWAHVNSNREPISEVRYNSFDEAMKNRNKFDKTIKVHSLDITPEMQQSVLYEGQPMFNAQRGLPTDTPEFKKWFGNSKVVDENGNPLVVYHGTNKSFNEFSKQNIGNRYNVDKEGFFFSSDPYTASEYAEKFGEESFSNANIIPVYVKIENPLTIEELAKEYSLDLDEEMEVYSVVDEFFDYSRPEVLAMVKKYKKDGVILNYGGETLVMAFEPNQIKSIYNEGSFDPDNPNIMFNARGEEPNQIDFGVGIGQVFTNVADKVQALRMTKEFERANGIESNPKLKKWYREFLTAPQWFFDKEPRLQRVWDIIDKNLVRNVNEETAILKEEIWKNGKGWKKLPENLKTKFLGKLKLYEADLYEAQNNKSKMPYKTFQQFADQFTEPEIKDFILSHYKPTIEQAFEYVKEVDRYIIVNRTPENPALEDYNSYRGKDAKEKAKLFEAAKNKFFKMDPNAEGLFENELLKQPANKINEVKALNDAWNNNRKLREDIAETLIDEKYKAIEGRMYFPSSRLGKKYFLSAVYNYNAPSFMPGMTPETYFTTDDRPQYLETLKQDLEQQGYEVKIGKFADAQKEILDNAISQEDLLDLAILTGVETDNKVLDRLLKSVLAKGFTKHFIPKKFTPGFQYTPENFEVAIDKYIGSVPYFKNRTIGGYELDDELAFLKDNEIFKPGSNNEKYIQDLRNKLESRDETLAQGLRAASSVWYLALRPSYLVQQIVQPLNTLLPLLPVTAKELGLKQSESEKAFAESMKSSIVYYTWKIADKILRLQGKQGLSNDFGLGKEFLEVIKRLEQQGVGKPLRSLEIIGEQTDPTRYYNPNPAITGVSTFAKILGLPGIFVEDFTRAQGIRAFYLLGKKAGLKGDDLVDFISKNIAKSYGPASGRLSKPPGYKVGGDNVLSKGLRTAVESHLTFKNFAFMNYGQWGKTFRAMKQDSLLRPLLYKLSAQVGLGGIKYMMWTSTILSLLSGIYGMLDIPEDPEEQYEELFKHLNKLVPGLGDAVYKGVASVTFKVDLSALFSQQAPFITEDVAFKQDLGEALEGAPIQLAKDITTGIAEGDMKKLAPAGIKNFITADTYGDRGLNWGSRQLMKPEEITDEMKTKKQLGFTPLEISEKYQEEKSRTVKSKQLTDIVRDRVDDEIIPLIQQGKDNQAKKKFIELFEMVKKNGSMTEFQQENIKTVDQFISRYIIGRLELRGEARQIVRDWHNPPDNGKNDRYQNKYQNKYGNKYKSRY